MKKLSGWNKKSNFFRFFFLELDRNFYRWPSGGWVTAVFVGMTWFCTTAVRSPWRVAEPSSIPLCWWIPVCPPRIAIAYTPYMDTRFKEKCFLQTGSCTTWWNKHAHTSLQCFSVPVELWDLRPCCLALLCVRVGEEPRRPPRSPVHPSTKPNRKIDDRWRSINRYGQQKQDSTQKKQKVVLFPIPGEDCEPLDTEAHKLPAGMRFLFGVACTFVR